MSDKAMREEMLEELDRCWVIPLEKGAAVKDIWESSGFKAREAIRSLIEHGPEVDEDTIRAIIEITACFDGKGVWGYDTEIGTAKEVIDRVANILRNAGISVTVKG